MHRTVALLIGLLALAQSATAEVYRWTDEQGKVHYGDQPPERRKASAKVLDVVPSALTDADRRDAAARLERDRAKLAAPSAVAAPPPAASPAPIDPAPLPTGSMTPCQAAWKAYEESYACFDPYRISRGRVRAEGYDHCKPVAQPVGCRYEGR